jgi:hypothetical protein
MQERNQPVIVRQDPRQLFNTDRREMLNLALSDRPVFEKVPERNFQEEIEDKEIGRLEEKLKYYRERSDQRRKQREARERSGFNKLLRDVSDYERFQ